MLLLSCVVFKWIWILVSLQLRYSLYCCTMLDPTSVNWHMYWNYTACNFMHSSTTEVDRIYTSWCSLDSRSFSCSWHNRVVSVSQNRPCWTDLASNLFEFLRYPHWTTDQTLGQQLQDHTPHTHQANHAAVGYPAMHDNYTLIIHKDAISTVIFQVNLNQATMPVPSQDKLGGCGRNSIRRKNGGMRHVGRWLVRMEWRQLDCRCVCLWYLPLHHKVHKISSGTSSPRWSRKMAVKTVVHMCMFPGEFWFSISICSKPVHSLAIDHNFTHAL